MLTRYHPLGKTETGSSTLSLKGKDSRERLAYGFSFPIREGGYNQAAPGGGAPYYPKKGMTGRKWIALSGDGSQVTRTFTKM